MASAGIQAFLSALDEPAMVVDRGIVRHANEAAKTLLGPAIEGNDVRLAIRHPQALEHILPGASADVEISGIGQFGRPWTLLIRVIADRMLLVRLIDRSATIAAERMRVDFVANASHELRTPLATILGYSETLADDDELAGDEGAKFGSIIRSEAKRMLRIIEDLMSLSRIEAGRFGSPADPVPIGEIAASAVENACRGAEHCSVRLDLEQGLPDIPGDRAQLMQLLDNLLNNALRYGCERDDCVIRVSAILDGNWIQLAVADNGPGIAREHLLRVTERFYRVDAARSRDSGGTGLGLAIVKHIVERHRGTLEIKSADGMGTEVVVRLPVAP